MSMRQNTWTRISKVALLVTCGGVGVASVQCGFGEAPMGQQTGTGGTAGAGSGGTGGSGSGGSSPSGSGGTIVETGSGGTTGSGGASPTGSGGAPGTGTGGAPGTGTGGMVGTGGAGGAPPAGTPGVYQVHGTWPTLKPAIASKPGTLSYTKVTAHTRFLAESCSIADYNKDGMPDISSGRRWYPGPAFTTGFIFRGGHDDLPRAGSPRSEIVDGVSDDWSDFPWDVDGDGWTDIINIASSDANTPVAPQPRPQQNATGFWYKNPGSATPADAMWAPTQVHGDIRHEQHGILDVDGDGKPEIFGACKGCNPVNRKGYYKMGATPAAPWTFVPVTGAVVFPFGGTGWMHGLGFGDVNMDGKPDMLDRNGVWLQGANATTWNPVNVVLYDGNPQDQRGGSHMFAFDVDGDGDGDIVSAEGAHHNYLAWYEQTTPMTFVKHRFMGTESPADRTRYGAGFSQPHALHVADMDGDGVPDVVTGKMRWAHPLDERDPDPEGTPVVYVFKTIRNRTPAYDATSKVTFEPHLVDPTPQTPGVGRQLSVGHANNDGIMDICVATKVGLAVFLGK